MKNCKNCGIEFEPKHQTRGHEQIYCSIKCRTDAYKKRTEQKMKDVYEEKQPTRLFNSPGQDVRIEQNGGSNFNVNLDLIEKKYEAKTEALEYKMRYEQCLKDLEEYKRQVMELENEIDELTTDDHSADNLGMGGVMGSVMEIAKSNPEIGTAIGKLLQHQKVQNLVLALIPDTSQKE